MSNDGADDKSKQIDPKEMEAFIALGMNYDKIRHDKDIEIIERTMYAEVYIIMGFVFVLKGNYEKAIELCEKAMNLNPESALAPFAIGVVSDMEGDLDRAIGFYEKALAISPESAILCHILSASYSEREHGADRDKAQELFVKVKSVNPGYEGTFNMGKGYINIGEYDKSILLLKAAALLGHDIARRFLERKNITW